jgi:shikimate kinase
MTDSPREVRGIALIGYRGTGKSTVGLILAERLERQFVDLDREIERRARREIRAIFDEDGEPAFRALESRALVDMAESTRLRGGILATGGGAVLLDSNRRLIRQIGFVAWLTADADTLARRLRASQRGVDDRPALTAAGTLAEIAEVLEGRTPLYREVADAEVSTVGRDPEQVADAVLEAWARHQRPGVVR